MTQHNTRSNARSRRQNEREPATGRPPTRHRSDDGNGDEIGSGNDRDTSPDAVVAAVFGPTAQSAEAEMINGMRRARAAVVTASEQGAGRSRSAIFELFVLGKLLDGPRHGYLLHQIISVAIGPLRTFNWNTLYPLIRQLEADRLIAPVDAGQAPAHTMAATLMAQLNLSHPAESSETAAPGAHSARSGRRKAYAITTAGRERFLALMREQGDYTADYPDLFNIKRINFGHVPLDWQVGIVRHYCAYLRLLLDYLRIAHAGVANNAAVPDSERPHVLRMLDHRRALAEADLAWAEAELAAISAQPPSDASATRQPQS